MTDRYRKLAAYNSWANARLYEAAAAIPEADRRADRGAFFKSLHGTLNHLLVGDRIWMRRFTGEGEAPARLDTILFEDFADLREARVGEDKRIEAYVENLDDEALSGSLSYKTVVNPARVEQRLSEALDHFFNHRHITAARPIAYSRRSLAMPRPSTSSSCSASGAGRGR